MQCVILAAGRGRRMMPLTRYRPKSMIPIANQPISEYLIIGGKQAGISEFILVIGYQDKVVTDYYGDGSDLGVSIKYAYQERQKGTADALLAARDLISGPFIATNGDMIITERDIEGISKRNPPCLGYYPSDHAGDFGVVGVDGTASHGVYQFHERPAYTDHKTINAGIYLFDPDIFDAMKRVDRSIRGELELTSVFSDMIWKGNLTGYALEQWLPIKNPWDILEVNKTILRWNIPLEAKVGEGTVIKPGTVIEGNVVIGKNCTIGPHAYIRGSTAIGDNCHIGHCSEVKNSVIMEGTGIPHFGYVGDSIIGSRCNLGAGTKIANLRHDRKPVMVNGIHTGLKKFGAIIGDNTKFGINCSINTGSSIGNNVMVGPGKYVTGKIEDNVVI